MISYAFRVNPIKLKGRLSILSVKKDKKVLTPTSKKFFSTTSERTMPGNIEIKAKVADLEALKLKAKEISSEHFVLDQSDIFFKSCVSGCRLKLRREKDVKTGIEKAVLIAYERPDITGPKFSHYVLTPIPEPATLEEALSLSNGITGRVDKLREVFIVKRGEMSTRVHLDQVKGLGSYLEFEVIVEKDSQLDEANSFAEYLSTYFHISKEDHVPGAYMNLLQDKQ